MMSFRPKEKVVSVIRKIFKTGNKVDRGDGTNDNGGTSKSPMRRSRRYVRGGFLSLGIPLNSLPTFSAISPSPNNKYSVKKHSDVTIRTKRLMKEYREIQKSQHSRKDSTFTVSIRPFEALLPKLIAINQSLSAGRAGERQSV